MGAVPLPPPLHHRCTGIREKRGRVPEKGIINVDLTRKGEIKEFVVKWVKKLSGNQGPGGWFLIRQANFPNL
jgi:hypothetical protein